MNQFDIENIKKELAKREAANYKWNGNGTIPYCELTEKSTEELNKLLKDFDVNKKSSAEQEIKKLVDDIFEKFSDDPDDNMIVLGACNYYDDSRHPVVCDYPLSHIDFDGFEHKYNNLAYPIGRNWDSPCYDNHYKGKDKEKYESLTNEVEYIIDKLNNLGLKSIYDYWNKENDAINECWYGVHAITKDYHIVAFVIRDDGMLCDEEGFDTFYNHTLYTIK